MRRTCEGPSCTPHLPAVTAASRPRHTRLGSAGLRQGRRAFSAWPRIDTGRTRRTRTAAGRGQHRRTLRGQPGPRRAGRLCPRPTPCLRVAHRQSRRGARARSPFGRCEAEGETGRAFLIGLILARQWILEHNVKLTWGWLLVLNTRRMSACRPCPACTRCRCAAALRSASEVHPVCTVA